MPLDDKRCNLRYDRKREKKQQAKAGQPAPDEEPLPPPVAPIHADKTVGRNEPCPCGSGKKYKQCHGRKS